MGLYLAIGIFSGFMSGMFGIGGGSVRIPLLFMAELPLLTAYGINLLVIPFSSTVGAITHRRQIHWDVTRQVIGGGLTGTVVGAAISGFIDMHLLALLFGLISILTVAGIHFNRVFPNGHIKCESHKKKIIVAGTFALNFLTALRGGSGGSLFPAFLRFMSLNMRNAIGTSLFATIFTSAAGGCIFWFRGDIAVIPALSVIFGSMAGAGIGGKISLKTKPAWLETGLSIVVIAMACGVMYKAFRY